MPGRCLQDITFGYGERTSFPVFEKKTEEQTINTVYNKAKAISGIADQDKKNKKSAKNPFPG